MERRQTYRNEKSVVKILKRALLSVTVLCNEEKLLQCWVLAGNYPGARHLQSYFVPSHHGAFGNLRGLSPGHLASKKKNANALVGEGGGGGSMRARLKKGKGRGRGRKVRKGKGTLSPQFLPPPSLPQATRVYNLIYGRPRNIFPQ